MRSNNIDLATTRSSDNRVLEIRITSEAEFPDSVAQEVTTDSNVDTLHFESPEKAFRPFSPARVELLRIIANQEPESKSELVSLTDRDRKSVYRDLKELEEYPFPLIRYEQEGRQKRPVSEYDKIELDIDLLEE